LEVERSPTSSPSPTSGTGSFDRSSDCGDQRAAEGGREDVGGEGEVQGGGGGR